MSRCARTFVAVAVAGGLATAAAGACSSSGGDLPTSTNTAGAAGASGGGQGGDGPGANGGSPPSASGGGSLGGAGQAGGAHAGAGGAAGTGAAGKGASGQGGSAGHASPVWDAFDLGFPACSGLKRLANPEAVAPAFTWEKCVIALDGCQQMKLAAPYAKADPLYTDVQAYDDGTDAWLWFTATDQQLDPIQHFILAKLDGTVGMVLRSETQDCSPFFSGIDAGHFALPFYDSGALGDTPSAVVTLVGPVKQGVVPARSPVTLTTAGTQPIAKGFANGRAALQWDGGPLITSVDWETAQAPNTLSGPIDGEIGWSFSTPDRLVAGAVTSPHWTLVASDGAAPFSTFLSDPAADLMTPRYTGSHLAWVRGTGADGLTWDKMEIWASPYSSDPSQLTPSFVAAWPYHSVVERTMAAHGRYATISALTASDERSVHVWSIPGGEHRQVTLPASSNLLIGYDFAGLTRDEVIFDAHVSTKNQGDGYLFRLPIASMPVIPP